MKAVVRFFTSVRLAIVLFILIISASILGTFIPQGRSAEEYLVRYGQLGSLFQKIQLTKLYHSFWYIALLFLFSLNILVCTLTRLSPKIRRVFRPHLEPEPKNLLALSLKDRFKVSANLAEAREKVRQEMVRWRYRVREREVEGRIFLLGRKRVLGWFGSDVVHAGLLIILAGGITSGLGGHRQSLTFHEGQAIAIPGAGFSVRMDRFVTEYYPTGSVKDWKSHLTVIEGGVARLEKIVEVNHPLAHRGYLFYQSGYGWDWQNPRLEIGVKKGDAPSSERRIILRVGETHRLDEGVEVSAVRFFPDFVLDENRQPATRSLEPNNPAVFLESWRAGEKIFSGWVFAKFPDFGRMHRAGPSDLAFELKDIDAPQYSVIQMAKDPGVPLIWVGSTVLMLGLFLAFYWPTRELRLVIQKAGDKSEIIAGGLPGKGKEAFGREFSAFIDSLRKSK